MNFDTFDPVDDHRAVIVLQKKYITSFTQNKPNVFRGFW